MNVVVGTAGHIDHGKTALVKALTGVDADRLPEEKQRGITIDIGFAELDLGDVHASFVDVPGHERFVKNMLAGASGIDIVMLIVAADEGVMPQTREHFNICRLLGISHGIVAITKADLVDDETLDLVQIEIVELVEGSFLENAEVVVTSASTGQGSDEMRSAIHDITKTIVRPAKERHALLPIDRSFSVKGHGAVVTGTLQDGEISGGSNVEILPDKIPVRVRGVQSHGRVSELATAGRRVAINLGGIDHSSIERGMLLADSGVFEPTQSLDIELELLANATRPLRSRQRVRVHIGTAELLGRVSVLNDLGEIAPGETDLVQLRLESATIATHGTRVIIRSYSPQETIAGGRVLEPFATRHRRKGFAAVRSFLSSLADTGISNLDLTYALITRAGKIGIMSAELESRTGWLRPTLDAEIKTLLADSAIVESGSRYLSTGAFESVRRKLVAAVKRHHETDPLSKGISKQLLRKALPNDTFAAVLESLITSGTLSVTGETVSLAERKQTLTPAEATARSVLYDALSRASLEVPKIEELLASTARSSKLPAPQVRKVLQTIIDSREIVKVTEDFYFDRKAIDSLIANVRYNAGADRTIDVAKFKEISGVSRKYAIPLLEYFDREKITIRTGDKRIIR
ncbi:MAG TPA: selenocysteine-specific translation elongation factor [Pyrinomonadaceae bacterium]|nr:selenocysteine-specific translation elongation factor [Pyrinomonadaceae bacterium]